MCICSFLIFELCSGQTHRRTDANQQFTPATVVSTHAGSEGASEPGDRGQQTSRWHHAPTLGQRDVTVPDTYAESHIKDTMTSPGLAADQAAQQKMDKYSKLLSTHIFCPVARGVQSMLSMMQDASWVK